MAKANNIKFKLIFLNKKKKDGTPYKKMMTILKDGENEVWVEVRFGDDVNEKQFKEENQIITADVNDVRLPLSLKPYEKDGKKKYPYVWVEKIVSFEKAPSIKGEPKQAEQSMFKLDEETTKEISAVQSNENLPFE